ncbi:MAG: hypothetical protein HY401_03170 [Elusimicrobia bacterium]|nr:hypothetical protein [Elusimicrobiota bacterium]
MNPVVEAVRGARGTWGAGGAAPRGPAEGGENRRSCDRVRAPARRVDEEMVGARQSGNQFSGLGARVTHLR